MTKNEQPERQKNNVPAIAAPRLPYHPAVAERFGVGPAEWRALTDAVFPLAKEPESVIMALAYCKARNLDPFKKPVHIVPMWHSQLKRMVETVWPGIGELRTTAFRTGQYAGRDETQFGPVVQQKVGKFLVAFPEWCQVTLYRNLSGSRVPFPGPRVYWLESYATAGRDDASPNSMWARRPHGQLEKCAEAAALRAAFPEEVGNEYTAEEMEGRVIDVPTAQPRIADRSTSLADRMKALSSAPIPEKTIDATEDDFTDRGLTGAATGAEEDNKPSDDSSAPTASPSAGQLGYEAAMNGAARDACPRKFSDAQKADWLAGFDRATAEAEEGGEG